MHSRRSQQTFTPVHNRHKIKISQSVENVRSRRCYQNTEQRFHASACFAVSARPHTADEHSHKIQAVCC